MIKYLFLIFSVLFSLDAFAITTVASIKSFVDGGTSFTTMAGACNNWVTRSTAQTTNGLTTWAMKSSSEVSPWTCIITGTTSGATPPTNDYSKQIAPGYSCLDSTYTLSVDKLTCTKADPPPCTGGLNAAYRYMVTDATGANVGPIYNGSTLANDGNSCEVDIVGVRDCYQTVGTKITWCYYDTMSTGSAAAPGAVRADRSQGVAKTVEAADANSPTTTPRVNMPPTKANAQGSCPVGSVQGGTDSSGTTICVGTGTQPLPSPSAAPKPVVTVGPPVTMQNADGTSTVQTITTTKNADGSSTTTVDKVTSAPDGSTTKAQDISTSVNTAGDPGKMTAPTPTPDLCTSNPNLQICKNSAVAGSCAAISCSGDAIQCATLRAAELMRCKGDQDTLDIKNSGATALGDAILAGNDPSNAAINTMKAGTTVDLSTPSLDTAGFLGGGSCLSARTITIMGRAVPMEFASICSAIIPLRYAVMACASVLAYLIVARSVVGV